MDWATLPGSHLKVSGCSDSFVENPFEQKDSVDESGSRTGAANGSVNRSLIATETGDDYASGFVNRLSEADRACGCLHRRMCFASSAIYHQKLNGCFAAVVMILPFFAGAQPSAGSEAGRHPLRHEAWMAVAVWKHQTDHLHPSAPSRGTKQRPKDSSQTHASSHP